MSQNIKLKNRPKPSKLFPKIDRLLKDGRTDEAEELVRYGEVKSNARTRFIHGRGYIPRNEVE